MLYDSFAAVYLSIYLSIYSAAAPPSPRPKARSAPVSSLTTGAPHCVPRLAPLCCERGWRMSSSEHIPTPTLIVQTFASVVAIFFVAAREPKAVVAASQATPLR